jgi:tetratricopeptide (TPR) repeat protein
VTDCLFGTNIIKDYLILIACVSPKEKALKASQTYVNLNPNSVPALIGLAHKYLFVGNKKAALEQYKIIKELDPTAAEALLARINQ